MKHSPFYMVLIAVFILSGCISGHTERVADVNPLGWLHTDTVWVAFENRDTVSYRDLSIFIRTNTSRINDILDITVCTVTPDSTVLCEKVPLNIAGARTKNNDHFESVVPYRYSSILSLPGVYRFGFVPGSNYSGITAIGIKSDNQP